MNSEIRLLKSKDQIEHAESTADGIAAQSGVEVYTNWDQWSFPTNRAVQSKHPLSRRPLWREILTIAASPVSDSDTMEEHLDVVAANWPVL